MPVVDEMNIIISAEIASAINNLKKVQEVLNQTGKEAKTAKTSFVDFASSVAGFTTLYNAGADAVRKMGKMIFDMGKTAITTAMDFEQARIVWGVLVQDMEVGSKKFEEIRRFAQETPLSFEAAEQGARTLKGFGIEVDNLLPMMQMLGDLAIGDNVKFERLSLVFGQVKAQNKALTQDLYQFVNSGVPIFELLSKVMKVNIADMKDIAREGGIGFREVEAAIKLATGEGGTYHDMMEKISTKTKGQWQIAQDNWKIGLSQIGDAFLPIVNGALKIYNDQMDKAAKIGKEVNITSAVKGLIGGAGFEDVTKYIEKQGIDYTTILAELYAKQSSIQKELASNDMAFSPTLKKSKEAELIQVRELTIAYELFARARRILTENDKVTPENQLKPIDEKEWGPAKNVMEAYTEALAKYRNEMSKFKPIDTEKWGPDINAMDTYLGNLNDYKKVAENFESFMAIFGRGDVETKQIEATASGIMMLGEALNTMTPFTTKQVNDFATAMERRNKSIRDSREVAIIRNEESFMGVFGRGDVVTKNIEATASGIMLLGNALDALPSMTTLERVMKTSEYDLLMLEKMSSMNINPITSFMSFGGNIGKIKDDLVDLAEGTNKIIETMSTSDIWSIAQGPLNAYIDLLQNKTEIELAGMKEAGATEEQIAKRRNELRKKDFENAKALSLANIAISGALSITKAMELGPIFGIPAAVVVGGLVATQLALAASQQYVPMANGGSGVVTKPTLFLAGEAGPESFSFGGKGSGRGGKSVTIINNNTVVQNVAGSIRAERELQYIAANGMTRAARGY